MERPIVIQTTRPYRIGTVLSYNNMKYTVSKCYKYNVTHYITVLKGDTYANTDSKWEDEKIVS